MHLRFKKALEPGSRKLLNSTSVSHLCSTLCACFSLSFPPSVSHCFSVSVSISLCESLPVSLPALLSTQVESRRKMFVPNLFSIVVTSPSSSLCLSVSYTHTLTSLLGFIPKLPGKGLRSASLQIRGPPLVQSNMAREWKKENGCGWRKHLRGVIVSGTHNNSSDDWVKDSSMKVMALRALCPLRTAVWVRVKYHQPHLQSRAWRCTEVEELTQAPSWWVDQRREPRQSALTLSAALPSLWSLESATNTSSLQAEKESVRNTPHLQACFNKGRN